MRRLLLLSLVLVGCQKVAREKLDYGPEVAKSEINAALADAMGGITTAGARAGQGVAYLSTRRLGDSDAETTLGAATISSFADPAAAGALKLMVDTTARENGAMKTTRHEHPLLLNLVAARVAARASADPAPVAAPAPRVTYHRLRTAREAARAPAALKAKENCGGLARCEFDLRYVVFDVLAWPADGGAPQRVSVTLGFSAQTPYLPYGEGFDRFNGALVVDCRASAITLDARRVMVHDCRRLVDFQP